MWHRVDREPSEQRAAVCWAGGSFSGENFEAEPPQPLPPRWSFRQSGQPRKRRGLPGRRGAGDSNPWQPLPWQPLAAAGRGLRHCPAPTQQSTGALTCPGPKSPDSNPGRTGREPAGGSAGWRAEGDGSRRAAPDTCLSLSTLTLNQILLGRGGGHPCDQRCLLAAAFAPGGCQAVALTSSQAGHPSNPHHWLSQVLSVHHTSLEAF